MPVITAGRENWAPARAGSRCPGIIPGQGGDTAWSSLGAGSLPTQGAACVSPPPQNAPGCTFATSPLRALRFGFAIGLGDAVKGKREGEMGLLSPSVPKGEPAKPSLTQFNPVTGLSQRGWWMAGAAAALTGQRPYGEREGEGSRGSRGSLPCPLPHPGLRTPAPCIPPSHPGSTSQLRAHRSSLPSTARLRDHPYRDATGVGGDGTPEAPALLGIGVSSPPNPVGPPSSAPRSGAASAGDIPAAAMETRDAVALATEAIWVPNPPPPTPPRLGGCEKPGVGLPRGTDCPGEHAWGPETPCPCPGEPGSIPADPRGGGGCPGSAAGRVGGGPSAPPGPSRGSPPRPTGTRHRPRPCGQRGPAQGEPVAAGGGEAPAGGGPGRSGGKPRQPRCGRTVMGTGAAGPQLPLGAPGSPNAWSGAGWGGPGLT